MWSDKLKELGVNIHAVATGAGAGFQNELWEISGSSSYLSGASFPYSAEEQEDLLGFMPGHFCNEQASIDLASSAYMKAYKFGGKKPIGIGLTASVASTTLHRGDHRIFATIITNERVVSFSQILNKSIGNSQRIVDGRACDDIMFNLLVDTLGISDFIDENNKSLAFREYKDNTNLARQRFFERPYFTINNKRFKDLNTINKSNLALMPGAFNPPHEGHFGMHDMMLSQYNKNVVFEITAEPPHKSHLTVQELLQRAKLLQGYNRLFTKSNPTYLDKARLFPGIPFVMGADAALRMLDPKWGNNITDMLKEFQSLKTRFYVADRMVDGKVLDVDDVCELLNDSELDLFFPLDGDWNISSSQLREKL